MAKRDPESEPMDEAVVESDLPTVGERLRAAREQNRARVAAAIRTISNH